MHDDALVIIAVVAHLRVQRVLFDSENSVNIIFKKALDQLHMRFIRLKPINVSLIRFIEAAILPLGIINLPLYLGEAPNQAMQITTFMVID